MESIYTDVAKEKFKHVGKNKEKMEVISRPSLNYWQDGWRRLKQNRVAFAGLIIIGMYIVLAIVGPKMVAYDYTTTNASATNLGMSSKHWFGTDKLGRDMWVRVWMGARVSLTIGFTAAIINGFIGVLIGGISGYYGGIVDMLIMRMIDVLYGIPYIIVAILVMMVLGSGMKALIIAMVIVGWIGMARFIRGEVLRLKEQDFVLAAKLLGVSEFKIIYRHMIPNVVGLMITTLTMAVPGYIFSEAFLSYIGLGIQPPDCSWGSLAKIGAQSFRLYPYQLFIPAFFVSTTMLALNLLGDGLRDALDPKLRGQEK
ncbi:ABC transporter permease [Geosporobacter ferrireducens]|nr:ABC transporter permease [Geosporobacter ferrireducens]